MIADSRRDVHLIAGKQDCSASWTAGHDFRIANDHRIHVSIMAQLR